MFPILKKHILKTCKWDHLSTDYTPYRSCTLQSVELTGNITLLCKIKVPIFTHFTSYNELNVLILQKYNENVVKP